MILINSSALIGGKLICEKNPLQVLLSSLNALISTNEITWIYKDHVTFKNPYEISYHMKTPLITFYENVWNQPEYW